MVNPDDILCLSFAMEKRKMAFVGTYEHKVDAKNRIRIPAKFRKAMGDEGYYIAKGTGKYLFVYTEAEVQRIMAAIADVKTHDERAQTAVRMFTASLIPVEEDPQGRVVLSAELRKYAGIKGDIVTLGVNTRLEIWAKETYDETFNGEDSMDMATVYKVLDL